MSNLRLMPITILAALALLLVAAVPVLAAPSGQPGSGSTLADHIGECNADVSLDAEGDLVVDVDGTVLTDAQLATLDATATAALFLAAEANGDVCVSVTIGEGDLISVDAHIAHCLTTDLTVNEDGSIVIDGVTISSDLIDARQAAVLQVAAEADADADATACFSVAIYDNETTVDLISTAVVEMCATLQLEGETTAVINGETVEIDAFTNNSAEADFSSEVEVGIVLTGRLEADGTVFVQLTAEDREGCGDDTGAGGTPTPTPTPTDDAGAEGTPTPAPTMLPDASMTPGADATSSTGLLVLLGGLLLVSGATYVVTSARR